MVTFLFLLTGLGTVSHGAVKIQLLVVLPLQSWRIRVIRGNLHQSRHEVSLGLFLIQMNLPYGQDQSFHDETVRHLLSQTRYTVSLIGHCPLVNMVCSKF